MKEPWLKERVIFEFDREAFDEARVAADLTLGEISRRTGLTVPFLCDLRFGRRKPSQETIQKLRDALEPRESNRNNHRT